MSSKKSSHRSIDSDDNQFSFSFNNFAGETKPAKLKKISTGLCLLTNLANSQVRAVLRSIRLQTVLAPAAMAILQMFKIKKKRAVFIKWYVQSIKVASEFRVQSAISTASQLNSFSRRYISCSIIFNLFNKSYINTGQKLLMKLHNLSNSFESRSNLCTYNFQSDIGKGFMVLIELLQNKKFEHKGFAFKAMQSDLSLQRQAFIQSTDRCIILSEQLFQAKESKEKAEFEKEELLAVLESKTDELNKLMDIVEEYKTWKIKLSQLENTLNDEINYWKNQASKLSSELDKKSKEVIEVYSDKKKAEEECLKAYRTLDVCQKLNLELQKSQESEKPCEKCDQLLKEITTYEELIEEFKKNEEKYLNSIKDLQEQVSRPPSSASTLKSKAKLGKKPVKRTLEFEKQSISENETQLAVEIVNLNKSLSKFKHENKTLTDLLRKCQQERDELKKLMVGKDESLVRLRKENDQLCLSLSTDHYKSVHKLEQAHNMSEQKAKDLVHENLELTRIVEELRNEIEFQKSKIMEIEAELNEFKFNTKSNKEDGKLSETMTNLQAQFFKLKEMSDKQIQTIESLKQDNFQLMQSVESFKALARSNKLHADKAMNDADTYSNLIKKMEHELLQVSFAKESAEKEVVVLKQHLMKLLSCKG